jgi:cytochrome c oxidase subunit III
MALSVRSHPGADATTARSQPRLVYSGGGPPALRRRARAVENGVLGMAIFLGSETMVFAALISAFLILRASNPAWPPLGQPRLPVGITGLNTMVLLFSAYTMWRATSASRAQRGTETVRWLGATAALGVTFLAVQGTEWVRLVAFGLHASSSLYGATFYTLIGCHGLHVFVAVIALLAVLCGTLRAQSTERCWARLRVCQLYWLFVVGIWPLLYVLVYLT